MNTFSQSLVAWDLRGKRNNDDGNSCIDADLGHGIIDLAKRCCESIVELVAFCISGALTKYDLNLIQELGFKVHFVEDSTSDNLHISVSNSIILWLWDLERNRKSSLQTIIILFSQDDRLGSLTKPLKERSVDFLKIPPENPFEWENIRAEYFANNFTKISKNHYDIQLPFENKKKLISNTNNYQSTFDDGQQRLLGKSNYRSFSNSETSTTTSAISPLTNKADNDISQFVDSYSLDISEPMFNNQATTSAHPLAFRRKKNTAMENSQIYNYASSSIDDHRLPQNFPYPIKILNDPHQNYSETTSSSRTQEHHFMMPLSSSRPIPVALGNKTEIERGQRHQGNFSSMPFQQQHHHYIPTVGYNSDSNKKSMRFEGFNDIQHIGKNNNQTNESYSQELYTRSYPNIMHPSLNEDEHDAIYSYDIPYHYDQLPNAPSSTPHQFTDEEKELVDELGIALNSSDVQLTVSTLRKIYTKQYRDFRIPLLLKGLHPETFDNLQGNEQTIAMVNSASFTLQCIQWCIGAQKKSNAVSFKYKMNKKISHWLLNEQMRKGMPSFCVPELSALAVSVAENILKNAAELDFTLEILEACRTYKAIDIILPYAELWLTSDDQTLVVKAKNFIQSRGSMLGGDGSSPIGDLTYHNNNKLTSAEYSRLSQTLVEHQALAMEAQTEGASITSRLFVLLQSYPNGILGSRIPIIFRDKFGESLRLRGLKLKDLMLAISGVEIIGNDGPGDKVFRLKPIPYY